MVDVTQSYDHASMISDEIATAEAHLAKHLRGRLSEVRLSIHLGGVVITGRTRSYYVKQLAQHAVMERVSLPIVANEITVRGV